MFESYMVAMLSTQVAAQALMRMRKKSFNHNYEMLIDKPVHIRMIHLAKLLACIV